MGLLTSRMSVTRFRVTGDLPDRPLSDFLRDRLAEYAFKDPPQGIGREEVEGWAEVPQLLDTDFADINTWLHNDIAVFGLRIDKKRLPPLLFKATLNKRCQDWCTEHGLERCPASVRAQVRDLLEEEWLRRQLPSVKLIEIAWRITDRQVLVHARSETVLDRVRKRFFRTFGLRLSSSSPLDALRSDPEQLDALIQSAPTLWSSHA